MENIWHIVISKGCITLSDYKDTISKNFFYCRFLRLNCSHNDQLPLWSSNHRHSVLKMMPRVESISNVVAILGDQTDVMYSFFRDGGGKDEARTVVVGIFNISRKIWSIYTQNPKTSLPVLVIPLTFKWIKHLKYAAPWNIEKANRKKVDNVNKFKIMFFHPNGFTVKVSCVSCMLQ